MQYNSSSVVGIDLFANEVDAPSLEQAQSIYVPIMEAANSGRINLKRTMHSGELGDVRNVRDSILMGANRVGHGTRLIYDPITLQFAGDTGFPVVCALISNRVLESWSEGYSNHPCLHFLRLGVRTSQTTDDQGVFRSTIADDCAALVAHTDIQYTELLSMSINAIDASFASDDVKSKLHGELDAKRVVFEEYWAVQISVAIKTDDHPTETSWSLIDVCPRGREVTSGGPYTNAGVVETTVIRTRDSRYLFTIVDTGGDGLCCNHGANGYYKVTMDGVEQLSGGEFEITEGAFFGTCTMPTTSKPTNQMTAPPTNNPTSPGTTSSPPTSTFDMVAISTEIKFDNYPSDITWKMENTCYGGNVELDMGGPYPQTPEYEGKTKPVFNTVTSNGSFKFTINDSFGDGLCCTYGNGGYTITYGTKKITGDFKSKFQEIQEFGSEAKCPSASGGMATYDAALGAPKCASVDPSGMCTTTGTGLLECKKLSGEPNGPNTLDSCTDGTNGVCTEDESIQDITVMSITDNVLSNRGKAKIKATVYAFNDGSEDQVDFFYSTNPGPNPNWKFISSARPSAGGKVIIESDEFLLESYMVQAIRVNMRWVGKDTVPPQSCAYEDYNDVDDLVFTIEPDFM